MYESNLLQLQKMNLLHFVLLLIAIENLADIITNNELFEKPRIFFSRFPILGKLITCKYCQTWWLSLISISCISFLEIPKIVFCFLAALAMHRIINLLSEFSERYLNRAPTTIYLLPNTSKEQQEER